MSASLVRSSKPKPDLLPTYLQGTLDIDYMHFTDKQCRVALLFEYIAMQNSLIFLPVQNDLIFNCISFLVNRYFEGYGIIRDIVHSHILQTIALFAMEPPVSLDGEDIRNEKVNWLCALKESVPFLPLLS